MSLKQTELDVLLFLSENGESTQNEIKAGCSSDPSTHNGFYVATARMVEQGFILRKSGEKTFIYFLNPETKTNFHLLKAIG